MAGIPAVRQPTIFLEFSPAPAGTAVPDDAGLPGRDQVEQALFERALQPFLEEIGAQRARETEIIAHHMEISLNELIHRQNLRMAELLEAKEAGDTSPLLFANLKTTEDRLDELNARLERRRAELEQERRAVITDVQHHGRAWVLPHPERAAPTIAPMVRDDEVERIAVQAAIAYEEARGWTVVSVEQDNRGFDLISRKPHPEDSETAIEVRFIEVKGRAAVGDIALTANEYKTAERLKQDYWLYAVFNCLPATQARLPAAEGAVSGPELHAIQDPTRLGWQPVVKVEHYHVSAKRLLEAANA